MEVLVPRVLLVDDHEELLRAWRRLLAPSCVVVDAVSCGQSARRAAAACHPDVIVLDLVLPDASGIALCPELVALAPGATIVIVTARCDTGLDAAARSAGAYAFAEKLDPDFDLEDVVLRAARVARDHAFAEHNLAGAESHTCSSDAPSRPLT